MDEDVGGLKVAHENVNPGIDQYLLRSLADGREHTIKSFLSRPLLVANGNWTVAHASLAMLEQINTPGVFLASARTNEKMQGFFGIRATTVVRVQINAEPFQQGRLLLTYFPQWQYNQPRYECAKMSLPLRTQLPRVEIDCATDTSVELEMPYVGPQTHYEFRGATGQGGIFDLSVYSVLIAPTGSTTVGYTVWAWMKDIHLDFPARAHAGSSRKNVPQIESPSGHGSISSIMRSISAGVSAVGNAVPSLVNFAKPAAWALDAGAKVASYFGWSKPSDSSPLGQVVHRTAAYAANVNGIDNSLNLGLYADNAITTMPGFAGSNVDEMAFSHLFPMPCWHSAVNWNTTDAEGTILTTILQQLPRTTRGVATAAGSITVEDRCLASYIGNYFRHWRGSWTYTFKVVKTKLHSGRLGIVYSPGELAVTMATDEPYLFKEVFDLRESNEFSITIPYVRNIPWSLTTEAIGCFALYVVNPLVAPANVYTSVEILIEVNGGPDLKFAHPFTPANLPILVVPAGMALVEDEDIVNVGPATAHALGLNICDSAKNDQTNTCADPISTASLLPPDDLVEQYTFGESIGSLRAFLKCFTRLYNANAQVMIAFAARAIVLPVIAAGSDVVMANPCIDLYSALVPIFGYFAGSVRIKGSENNNADSRLQKAFIGTSTGVAWNLGAQYFPNAFTRESYIPKSNVNEVVVPFWSTTHCKNAVIATTTAWNLNNNNVDRVYLTMGRTLTGLNVCRAIGEDFSAGFVLGALPLTVAANIPNQSYSTS